MGFDNIIAVTNNILPLFDHFIIAENSFSFFIFSGDINCDFMRKTDHVNAAQSLLYEFSLVRSWNLLEVDFTYCQDLQESSCFSTVDHFFWNHAQ